MERNELLEQLGRRLRLSRESAGLTRKAVCEKVGASPRSLQYWEDGASAPASDVLRALADLYGVSCDYLLCQVPDFRRVGRSILDRGLMREVEEVIREHDVDRARTLLQWMPSPIVLDMELPEDAELVPSNDARREVSALLHRFKAEFPGLAAEWANACQGGGA